MIDKPEGLFLRLPEVNQSKFSVSSSLGMISIPDNSASSQVLHVILHCTQNIVHQSNVHRQYSFCVVRVSGVRPILMTLSYRGMGARDVVQIIMNHFR